ncbi:hypothetical protein BSZ24_27950 [Bradyrhizobium canariense]|nr:hypothetical protein BSZ24_27950 [Bradyrhizobium canariense]
MTQQLDELAKPLGGGKLFLIQAGTTSTPQNCYQDTSLTLAWPNPVTLDAAGRIPQLFCADGNIKIRLTDKNGNQKLVQDNLLIVGPSGGGGGGGTVDPTTILATGDFKDTYDTGVLTGFVRCNGRTVGSAVSGATERANADAQALFQKFWGADPNLVISGGRGASAAADWVANKTLTLPDCKGRVRAALSDMGAPDSGRISTIYFGCTGLILGCVGGSENTTLTASQLPNIISNGVNTVNVQVAGALNVAAVNNAVNDTAGGLVAGSLHFATVTAANWGGNNTLTGTPNISVTSNNTGSQPHRTVQPTILVTTYIKL